jgi:hypothetical protein
MTQSPAQQAAYEAMEKALRLSKPMLEHLTDGLDLEPSETTLCVRAVNSDGIKTELVTITLDDIVENLNAALSLVDQAKGDKGEMK